MAQQDEVVFDVEPVEDTSGRIQQIIEAGGNLVDEIQKLRNREASAEYSPEVTPPDHPEPDRPEIDWDAVKPYAVWGGVGLATLWLIPTLIK